MSIWTLSRYWLRLFIAFTLGGLAMVVKEPIVDGRIPDLTRLALVAAVRFFWLQNWRHPEILWRFSYSICVLFLHSAGVDEGGTGEILVASLWTRLRVQVERNSTELLCRVSSLISVGGSLVGWGGTGWIYIVIGRGSLEHMESSSDGIICGGWGLSPGVISYGQPEGVDIFADHVYLG